VLDIDLALRFAAALGLGLLLGLERQRVQTPATAFAGVRTFALISLAGAVAAYMESQLGLPWLGLATFAAIAALVIASHVTSAMRGDAGMTTEVSALLAFLVGQLCIQGYVGVAAPITVAAVLLLTLKDWLHRLAERIETADVEATLTFAIITVIVLPLLPDRGFGPPTLEVINPYEIWLMVVLISGVDFVGYILLKVVGAEHGLGLTGLLGGLVSSTALTLGLTQRSQSDPARASALALGIVVAWSVMFFRVLAVTAAVAPLLLPRLAVGLGAPGLVGLAICFLLWSRGRGAPTASVAARGNPFELATAIRFGLLFGVVTFAAHAAQLYAGTTGLYLAGALAGLTDVDAISLSMARLASSDAARADAAAGTIAIAALANTLVKAGMVLWLGSSALRRVMLPISVAVVAAGAAAALLVGRGGF
jgi:uncharacterized membrane protein (DUF4010 family)